MTDTLFHHKAFVLLSGGQDSFVSLIWAIKHFADVETVTIHYQQSHNIEVEYAKKIASHFNLENTVYNLGDFVKSIAESTLLDHGDHNAGHIRSQNLPASFVPNRNGLFLTIISNHAFRQNMNHIHIVTGVCQTDFSGYPDCRDNYIKAKQLELSLGLEIPVTIHTPLMWKTKAETFEMARGHGKLRELIYLTMSCYNGIEELNDWGRGCGKCPACRLRKEGYEQCIKNNPKA